MGKVWRLCISKAAIDSFADARKDKADALVSFVEQVVNAAVTEAETKSTAAKANAAAAAAAAAQHAIQAARDALNATTAAGALSVSRDVVKMRAKADENISAAKANRDAAVSAANANITSLHSLTREQLSTMAPNAQGVPRGISSWSYFSTWITNHWTDFKNSTVAKYLTIALVVAAGVALTIFTAGTFAGAVLLYGGLFLLAANIGADVYWNMTVDGQGFGGALWSALTHDTWAGKAYAAISNYDLETGNYLGNSWEDRLSSGAELVAEAVAARMGARLGRGPGRYLDRKAHQWGMKPCFVEGTPIRLLNGSVPIEQIKAGDIVLSRDEYNPTAEVACRRVEEVFIRRAMVMYIGVAGHIIETTEEHPFWIVGRGWIAANTIRVGDRVLTATGEQLHIESVGESRREAVVYNFRVEELHTYFVGDPIGWGFDVWVHNTHVPLVSGFRVTPQSPELAGSGIGGNRCSVTKMRNASSTTFNGSRPRCFSVR